MRLVRSHRITSAITVMVLLIVVGAAASPGAKRSTRAAIQLAAQEETPAGAGQAKIFASGAEQGARWTGLYDCLKGSRFEVDDIDEPLDTYGIAEPGGLAMGNLRYGKGERFSFGRVTWTFAGAAPVPPASDENAVGSCIHQTFGPEADRSHWVKPYRTTVKMAEQKAARDPRWVTIRKCFAQYKIGFSLQPTFPISIAVDKLGVVECGHLIGFTAEGPISYALDKKARNFPGAIAFLACLSASYA